MATLPSNRTKLQAAISNQVAGTTADASANINAMIEAYDTIDTLNQKVDGLVSAGILSPIPPDTLSRQAIINGNFDIWQRGTSFSLDGKYTADRWQLFHNHSSVSVSQQANFAIDGSRSVARLTNNTRGAGSYFLLVQPIETSCCLPFINKKCTLSFQLRKSSVLAAGDVSARIVYTTAVDDTGFNMVNGTIAGITTVSNVNMSTNFQKCIVTATIPSNARTIGIVLLVNNSPTDGQYVEFAQVQLNVGDVAYPFQPKSFADELRDCMRYYEKSYDYINTPGTATQNGYNLIGIASNADNVATNISFKVRKRAAPSVTFYHSDGTAASVGKTVLNTKVSAVTTVLNGESGVGQINKTAGFTTGDVVSAHWTADSEL